MVANSGQLEMEMETLARARRVVIHRSPGGDQHCNRCDYFVCNNNNFVLFPLQSARQRGATAEETHRWLSIDAGAAPGFGVPVTFVPSELRGSWHGEPHR